jgi:hypothetical protein
VVLRAVRQSIGSLPSAGEDKTTTTGPTSEEAFMTMLYRLLCVAACLSTLSPVQAQTQQPGQEPTPIPTLRCEFKIMTACGPDGVCKPSDQLQGLKLPLLVTVDFENTVVAATDEQGYPRTDKIDAVAKSTSQLMLHGIDREFSWQLLIHDRDQIASLTMATADHTLSAFGSCTNK